MTIDFSQPAVRKAIIRFTTRGARSKCPFCKGRMIASVSADERIMILQGMYAGRCGTVSAQPGWSTSEFFVHFDTDKNDVLTRIIYHSDKFSYLPIGSTPKWLCELSIDDLSRLEDAALETALIFANASKRMNFAQLLLPLIATVRSRRLPVTSNDLWPTLVAHGFEKSLKARFHSTFEFGIELLTSLHGRPAIRRKRMRAMSRGRYLTPGQEEYFGPSPELTSETPQTSSAAPARSAPPRTKAPARAAFRSAG